MNLDETTLYGFIREDLAPGQELIQAIHAAFHAGMAFGAAHGVQPGIPFVVIPDAPTLKAVKKAQRKLEANELAHYAMTDTDVDPNVSAIVTLPLDKMQKQILSEYRLRKFTGRAAQTCNAGLDATCPPNSNAPVAQLRERLASGERVAGENPAGRSTSQLERK